MRLLEFDNKASLASVIEAIKAVPEKEVSLRIPADTPWLKNPVNEKILRKSVQGFGKTIHLEGHPDTPTEAKTPENIPAVAEPAERDEVGFVLGGDVMEETPQPTVPPSPEPVQFRANEELPTTPVTDEVGEGRFKRFLRLLVRRWPFALAAAFGLLLLLGAYVVLALPKADVNIIVEQRPLEREATLTASTSVTTIDIDARKIPALAKTSSQSGTQKTTTTGKKAVGTQAKGTVTVFNNTDLDKTFAAGQKITLKTSTGSGTLKYAFDTTVNVPKRTPNTETTDPFDFNAGSKEVQVTAVAIGPEYNQSINAEFTIDGFDAATFQAKNDKVAISGGSSRDIQIVAQADLEKLLTELQKDLESKGKTDIEGQAGSGYQVVSDALKTTVTSKVYDKKVGDEAAEVNLNLTIEVKGTVYSGQDLKEILSKTLEQAAPGGYEVSDEGQQTSADLVSVEPNGDLTFIGRIRANLVPKFDRDQLAKDLSGKKPEAAETYLKAVPSVLSYQVNIWPNLPDFFRAFPRDVKRIHISVSVQ